MKFKIFTIPELIYKKISYALVFIITVGCVVLYFYNRDIEEVAFITSLFYALFLFIISVYINSMSTKIQNMFHRKKEQYRSLKELEGIYKPTIWDKDDLLSYIIFVQGMTGRIDNGTRPFIRMNGFEYTDKYLKLEKSFLVLRADLGGLLNEEVNNYIRSHKLTKKVKNIFVNDIIKFLKDVDGWVDEYLDITAEEKMDFSNFIDCLLKRNKRKFKEWDRIISKIKKMIRKTNKLCHKNMIRIEVVYGEMLFETLSEENTLYTNFNVLEKLIQELKDESLLYSNFVELTDEYSENIHHHLENMDQKLELIRKEVEDISINTNSDYY